MNIYDRLGVKRIINAADSYTIIGGSLMPQEVVDAMAEAARSFVAIERLHDAVGRRLAELTRNEAAMVTSGAAAALAITTAACMTGADASRAAEFPYPDAERDEVVLHRCQDNGFVYAVRQTGAKVRLLDDRHPGSIAQLESIITERTACFLYFVTTQYEQDAIPLAEVIAVCKRRGVTVVVDAAAQLPPVSNLWTYTEMGADLVIFSGGKTLRGPQSTGLVVGKAELISACRVHSSPNVAIGRPMKVGKEEMIGLLAAVERYVNLDHEREAAVHERLTSLICAEAASRGLQSECLYPGPTGQSYSRALVRIGSDCGITAKQLRDALEQGTPSIWVNVTEAGDGLILNPLHLQEDEIPVIFAQVDRIIFQQVDKG